MGVDLEESDGAQDIGYPSIFLFNDPSVGYFGDMWFEGNSQYYLSNFNMERLIITMFKIFKPLILKNL